MQITQILKIGTDASAQAETKHIPLAYSQL